MAFSQSENKGVCSTAVPCAFHLLLRPRRPRLAGLDTARVDCPLADVLDRRQRSRDFLCSQYLGRRQDSPDRRVVRAVVAASGARRHTRLALRKNRGGSRTCESRCRGVLGVQVYTEW